MVDTPLDSHSSALNSPTVLFDMDCGLARITLNRPDKGNALDIHTIQALANAIHKACDNKSTRTILLQGCGKAFCVGGDIDTFKSSSDQLPSVLDTLLSTLNEAILKLVSSGLPVVSAVNGPVGGGGIGIALCADYVLASDTMKLRGGYSAIGLTPDAGSSWFLAQRIGAIRAKQIFFLNEPIDATACLAMGIVDAVYPYDRLLTEANALAKRLCLGSRDAHVRIKHLLDGIPQRSLSKQLQLEREYMVSSAAHDDAREGITAFIEKRAPRFTTA